jgi:hypothetical protein
LQRELWRGSDEEDGALLRDVRDDVDGRVDAGGPCRLSGNLRTTDLKSLFTPKMIFIWQFAYRISKTPIHVSLVHMPTNVHM